MNSGMQQKRDKCYVNPLEELLLSLFGAGPGTADYPEQFSIYRYFITIGSLLRSSNYRKTKKTYKL